MSGAKILVAPNSFKESLSAFEASSAISSGVHSAWPEAEVVERPLADGGDGTMDVLISATGGRMCHADVSDPLRREVESCFGVLGDGITGVVEMARASGLALLAPEERNPSLTTTMGTGELIRAALDVGIERLIVGVGGSATNDAGMGMAHALGVRFKDSLGRTLDPVGKSLERISTVDLSGLDPRLAGLQVTVACDVKNPLFGPKGAAQVYARQKGATSIEVEFLDGGLRRWAEVIERDLRRNVADLPGAGAAGGLGAGLAAFLDAELKSGVDIVMDAYELDSDLRDASLALTGEGRLDEQTAYGKAPAVLADRAKRMGVPVVAIVGVIEGNIQKLQERGISACFSLTPGPMDLETCLAEADVLLTRVTEEVIRLFHSAKRKDASSRF